MTRTPVSVIVGLLSVVEGLGSSTAERSGLKTGITGSRRSSGDGNDVVRGRARSQYSQPAERA
jgi:hypothetical protein